MLQDHLPHKWHFISYAQIPLSVKHQSIVVCLFHMQSLDGRQWLHPLLPKCRTPTKYAHLMSVKEVLKIGFCIVLPPISSCAAWRLQGVKPHRESTEGKIAVSAYTRFEVTQKASVLTYAAYVGFTFILCYSLCAAFIWCWVHAFGISRRPNR